MDKKYEIILSKNATKDLEYFKKLNDKKLNRKIKVLLEELSKHPKTGTGKPEKLKYNLSGCWSRRINHEHSEVS